MTKASPSAGSPVTTLTGQIATIRWQTDRTPKRQRTTLARLDEDIVIWPERGQASKALKPKPGQISSTSPVIVITLFDVPAERVTQAVRQVMRRQKATGNFAPVFLTDNLETGPIREAGYTFEYLPPDMFCQPGQTDAFERRFLTLWRKWSATVLIDFSRAGFLAERLEDPEAFIESGEEIVDPYDPRRGKVKPAAPVPTDVAALRAEYRSKGLDKVEDTFVLYRIIGNDLPPRHEVGQTLRNVAFMLKHEPPLKHCEKRWVVNRIVDPDQEAAVIKLLEEHDQPYLHIPFVLDDYRLVDWDLESFPDNDFFLSGRYHNMRSYDQMRAQAHARRYKNSYVINNNGARNAAWRDGRDRAKWVLPWDGNCFLTAAAWDEIVSGVTEHPYLKYFTVPMARALDNAELLDPTFQPPADEEPQMLFRTDAAEEFDETFYYGRRPKVELFYRLGIPGKWDGWPDDVWDRPRAPRSPEAGSTGTAGWVARLFSGQAEQEQDKGSSSSSGLRARGEARILAISNMLDRLDIHAMKKIYAPEKLTAYDIEQVKALAAAKPDTPEARFVEQLMEDAELALQRGPFSVVDKTVLAPSGDPHDYYNPAPYWWPNPATASGLPYVFRDGDRIPGTRLYELDSEKFDRTRLQRLFDDTTTLALAWVASGRDHYVEHAAQHVRTWFLDEKTRMNPHLLYAQVRSQTMHDHGSKSGLIEMKDLYYFLDAVRLIEQAGALTAAEQETFRGWLRDYLEWLQTSEQGIAERLSPNNHGTCYDLQTGAIAAFLGDTALLRDIFRTSRERMLEQFTPDGQQPHEMKRTQTAHYCAFNMHGWINLANMAEACGDRLWLFEAEDGRGLAAVFNWLLPQLARENWKYQQIEPFDRGRFLQLFFAARDRATSPGGRRLADPMQIKTRFFPHDGIKPFWMINPPVKEIGRSENWRKLEQRLARLETAAFEMANGPIDQPDPVHADDQQAKVLDKKLWGGFSTSALTALEIIRQDESTSLSERNRACRSLARWYFHAGNIEHALNCTEAMEELGVVDDLERLLLRADCLIRLGNFDAAAATVQTARKIVTKDANLRLFAANSASPTPAKTAQAINATLHDAALPDLLTATQDGLTAALPIASSQSNGPAPSHDRISVILTIDDPAVDFDVTIRSVLAQTWTALELIICDRTGAPRVAATLKALEQSDNRVVRLKRTPRGPLHKVLQAALDVATGTFVTRIEQGDIAHAMWLALQVEPLLSEDVVGTRCHFVQVDEDLRVVGTWAPDFTYVREKSGSLMLRTSSLRDGNGWDAVESAPDAFLVWRLQKSFGKDAVRSVLPRVPLIVSQNGSETSPGHLAFPFGQRRDDMRRLARWTAQQEEMQPETEDDVLALSPALPQLATLKDLDAVYIGDFSADAPALEQIVGQIAARSQAGDTVGVFFWPSYHESWSATLDPSVAEMIDGGHIYHVSAYDEVNTKETVIAQRSVLHHSIDGFPDLGSASFIVLGGPELTATQIWSRYEQRQMLAREVGDLFGQKAVLRTL